jgi:hypothetical protein
MPGFLNPDGSELVGALNPSSVGQALKVDADGNLYVVLGPNNVDGLGNLGVNSAAALAAYSGKAFVASDNLINAATAGSFPMAIFNPSNSGKTILIYSIKVGCANAGYDVALKAITADPAYNATAQVANKSLGNVASQIASHITYNNASLTAPGAPYIRWEPYTKSPAEILDMGPIILPYGSNHGITVWLTVYGAGYLSCNIEYIEF